MRTVIAVVVEEVDQPRVYTDILDFLSLSETITIVAYTILVGLGSRGPGEGR